MAHISRIRKRGFSEEELDHARWQLLKQMKEHRERRMEARFAQLARHAYKMRGKETPLGRSEIVLDPELVNELETNPKYGKGFTQSDDFIKFMRRKFPELCPNT